MLFPLVGIVSQICVDIDGDLEKGAGAAREEISVNLVERYSRVEIDAVVLQLGFLQNELRHELPEHLAHGVHAGVACPHVVNLMAHRHEDCLHTASSRCVVLLGVAVGDVAHADKSQRLLHIIKCFLETVQSADPAKGEALRFCEAICGGQFLEIFCRIPVNPSLTLKIS